MNTVHAPRGEYKTGDQYTRGQQLCKEGISVWYESVKGEGVARAFERYLETGDAEKITPRLRDFLMMRCGFIAHYDLAGFRHAYSDTRAMLAELAHDSYIAHGWGDHTQYVYADAMTSEEVKARIVAAIETHGEATAQREQNRERTEQLAYAQAVADRYGVTIAPQEETVA